MTTEYMPTGGVKELVKTAEGRRYLSKLQKKHELDILQPNDPRFNKVYGDQIKKRQEVRIQQEQKAKDEWQESQERKKFEKREGKKVL